MAQLIFVLLFFIPSIIAFTERKEKKLTILIVNILFGITIIGWIIALAMAVSNNTEKEIEKQKKINTEKINVKKHSRKYYLEGLSYGEIEVASILSRELNYKDYFIFNNLIIPSENNGSTQIDHVVISKFGIFVIESKDYHGWIFGTKDQPLWTQSLPGGKNKFQFQNPIYQNYGHIMSLKTILPFIGDNFINVIVFSNSSEIKTQPIENVLNIDQLIGYLNKYTEEKISESNIQLAIGRLLYICQVNDISIAEHVANLKNNHKSMV